MPLREIRFQNQRGLSLLEQSLVVGVASLLVLVVAVSMNRMREYANEKTANDTLGKFSAAIERYRLTQRPASYPQSLIELLNPPQSNADVVTGAAYAPLIEERLAESTSISRAVRGYYYVYTPAATTAGLPVDAYTLKAVAVHDGNTIEISKQAAAPGQRLGTAVRGVTDDLVWSDEVDPRACSAQSQAGCECGGQPGMVRLLDRATFMPQQCITTAECLSRSGYEIAMTQWGASCRPTGWDDCGYEGKNASYCSHTLGGSLDLNPNILPEGSCFRCVDPDTGAQLAP